MYRLEIHLLSGNFEVTLDIMTIMLGFYALLVQKMASSNEHVAKAIPIQPVWHGKGLPLVSRRQTSWTAGSVDSSGLVQLEAWTHIGNLNVMCPNASCDQRDSLFNLPVAQLHLFSLLES